MSDTGITWADVEACKAALEDGSAPFIRKPKHLLKQWQAQGEIKTPDVAQLGFAKGEYPPVVVLFYLLSLGLTPPPELMAAALQGWLEYINGAGQIELEEAFFGRPVQVSGNYAKRHRQSEEHFRLKVRYAQERKNPTALHGEGPAERAAGDEMSAEHLRRLVRKDQLAQKLLEDDELLEFAERIFEPGITPKPTTK